MFGNACFNDLISEVAFGEQCQCENDCDEVLFTSFETTKGLNAEELCSDPTSWPYKHMKNIKRNREGYDYRKSINKVLFNIHKDQSMVDEEECIEMVKYDLAIVTMEISIYQYSEMVRQEAVTIGKVMYVGIWVF